MYDDDPGFFTCRLAILGLGLMGGSLAMALHGKCAALLGIDPDPQTVELARQQHIVDLAAVEPANLLPQADVIILAAPVNAIINLLQELPRLHHGSPIVIDLGSTKVKIMQTMQLLPERFDPLGGHPMCGKEVSGLANADARLFQGASFAFTASPRTTPHARRFAEWLAASIGACPLWIDADVHDRWVSATSHLPYLVANALAYVTPLETAPLAGPGFLSTTRLAVSPPDLMMDVLMTNQSAILDRLHIFREHLEWIERLLAQGEFDEIENLLWEGARRKQTLSQSIQLGKVL
ncbi:MAG: prephenate dehydrogenase/arogenate dehydrogenase family protein [Anaerolineaceae bacterium]